MRKELHLWPQGQVEKEGKITVSAAVEQEGQKPTRLWFQVPEKHGDILCKTCDPFIVASIFQAMRTASKLVVHGQVSSSLLRNLEEYQVVWSNWMPKSYSIVDMSATNESEPDGYRDRQNVAVAFSGGLDSCFTAFRHAKGTCGRQRQSIAAGVMVHGFDIPLDDEATFGLAMDKSKKILESIGVELIPIATNIRSIDDNWDYIHGAAVAASLMLLQNGYRGGLIGSSFSYDSMSVNIPWGSSPLTDRFLSSDNFELVHDGGGFCRVEKLQHIAEWPEALEHMRVCWEGDRLDQNCCICEKCIRTIISYRALGLDLPKSFDKDITDEQIRTVRVPHIAILWEYRRVLAAAKSRGITGPWVKSLEECIVRNERSLTAGTTFWQKARSAVALRARLRRLYNRYRTRAE